MFITIPIQDDQRYDQDYMVAACGGAGVRVDVSHQLVGPG